MIASWRGHLKIVKVLLGAGAETDVQDQVCNVLCSNTSMYGVQCGLE